MRPRERVLAVLRGEQPDRVPKMVNFYACSLPGRRDLDLDAHFKTDIRFAKLATPQQQRSMLDYLRTLPQGIYVGSPEILQTYHDWGYHPEIERDAPLGDLSSIAQIAAAPLPNFMQQIDLEHFKQQVDDWHEKGYPVMASPPHLGGQLFETCYRLRGFEQFMIDLVENPSLVNYLLEQLTAMHLAMSLAMTRAGIDILALDDDLGENTRMLINPETWRTFFKPHVRTIIETCKRANPNLHIFWHSDGYIEPVIPDLIEIGVDILNPVAPDVMDPAKLKGDYGERLAFFGTVGTPQRWHWGTPDDIRAEVQERIQTVGAGGGLIISPAYDLEPEVRWDNVLAFFEAVENYGRY